MRKNCSSDREKHFEAEGLEFANILRSLEQFFRRVKGQKFFLLQQNTFLSGSWRFLKEILGSRNIQEKL